MPQPENLPERELDTSSKRIAALSYLPILCFIPYFLFADRQFTRFHARQGVMLFIVQLAGGLAIWVLAATVGKIPFLGSLLLFLIKLLFWLPVLGLMLLGLARSLTGEQKALPWIGQIAKERIPDPPDSEAWGG